MIILVSYSILVYGEFKSDTQIQIFPMVFRLDDPNYLVNDWYTNSVDTLATYPMGCFGYADTTCVRVDD